MRTTEAVHIEEHLGSSEFITDIVMWISGQGETVTLISMIVDFPRHLKLHLSEIEELMNKI
jgi:hypothetical protein